LLTEAAQRTDRLLPAPSQLKGGAAQRLAAKLVTEGLAKEIKAKSGTSFWCRDGDGSKPERGSYGDVLLIDRLRASIEKLNPDLTSEIRAVVLAKITRPRRRPSLARAG
jgi:hypothetical protein